ncbi:exosortase family protein XrtF [Flavobacterium sp. NRK F10]|uniref:exosortase family protein XrtF n=1 Tax=Flavobacterium sp. NRK F10 TaxID=2954931 RepID=UPI0020916D00|nr:exosortase family protein XrtF [Flavobacterium sp. NRK F10]MCO6175324.1 exosortase family protein XrtF [Flavobacterium sp. NRK F10]
MKTLLVQYKPFFLFLIRFLVFYFVCTFVYKMYLNQYNPDLNEVDGISQVVAEQTGHVLNLFGHNAEIVKHENEPSVKILYKGAYVSRIIEGCNAISIIILFAAFVFAFSSGFKRTFLFIVSGAVLIYILNIIRIVLLTLALYYKPEYERILHGTVFPLFIYGAVFLLWVFWVTKVSGYAKRNITE